MGNADDENCNDDDDDNGDDDDDDDDDGGASRRSLGPARASVTPSAALSVFSSGVGGEACCWCCCRNEAEDFILCSGLALAGTLS